MVRFRRSITFRYTLFFLLLFVVAEIGVYAALYQSTLALYERRTNEEIESELADLRHRASVMTVEELTVVISKRISKEPGGDAEYLLVGRHREYIAGNFPSWPAGIVEGGRLFDVTLPDGTGERMQVHRAAAALLANGYHLMVGRNLAEFNKLRVLIRRAFLGILALSVGIGLLAGYAISRAIAYRLERINLGTIAILVGDMTRRMPVSDRGDEYDLLALNLNRMLDRIEQLMNGMREVVDNVAHDLQKPITRLRSRIELALMRPADHEAHRETLIAALDEIGRILDVFNAILTIANAESGLARERFTVVDVARIAAEAAEIYEPVAEEAGLTIQFRGSGPVEVHGNPDLIAQAIANLLDNAVKYAPGTGALDLAVDRTARAATIVVADHGPGIPPEFRDKVTTRFYRLEKSRTTEGSGLGLSLVQAVALLHGGRLVFGDNGPGLVATLELPLAGRTEPHS